MLYLALKQMLSRKRQTALIFIGIGFGTMIYVIVAGLQFGFRGFLTEQLLNNTSHIVITGSDRNIDKDELRKRFYPEDWLVKWISPPRGKREEARLENPRMWFDRLEKDPEVLAYAPRLTISAIAGRGQFRANINLSGIDPEKQAKVTALNDYMKIGSLKDLSGGGNKIILGSGILDEIGAAVGDFVKISTGLGEGRPFKVVGKLHLGNEEMDKVIALGSIRDAQSLNKSPGRVEQISVALRDMELAQQLSQDWARTTRDKVQSWQEANAQFMQMIEIQDIMRAIMTGAILLVAAFGIYNVLSIMIAQKQKEIAILRSIGYGPQKILLLFLYQGLFLGFAGGLLGLALGLGINLLLSSIELGFDVGKSNHLPISYAPRIFFTAMFMAQAAASIASFLPARAASKLTPLEIIRGQS